MENIDVAYATQKGIACVNSPEGNRDAVAEHALGMLLCLFNNITKANAEVKNGKWLREENRGIELCGKTVGIIGYGNMGAAFAQRIQGFGVKVLAYDKYKTNFGNEFVKECSLQEIFEQADVLSLHTPLTEETNYLINDTFINSFKKPIYIINAARGKCLNTADLVKNIESGKVSGACLDVLEYEAVSFEGNAFLHSAKPSKKNKSDELIDDKDIPRPMQYLMKSDKAILTPHIAGWTHESNIKLAKFLAEKIIAVLKK